MYSKKKFKSTIKANSKTDAAILLLEIYQKECKSGYHKTSTPMFIEALFTLVHNSHNIKDKQMPYN
jgi:hypothetical protein